MKIYYLIILIIIILFLAYYYRQFKLNNYITIVNESHKITENFDDVESFDNSLPSNPTFIFETISGVTHIFKDNRYWKVENNRISISNEYISKYWNIKNSFIVDSGYYSLPTFELILLSKNKIYIYNLITNTLSEGTFIKDYYKGLIGLDESIKKLFSFQGHLYLYTKNNRCIIYDTNNDTIIGSESNIFPNDFSCAFIKYSDIEYQIPGGKLYFIKGHKYYIYNITQKKVSEGINFKLGFLKTSNKFEVIFNNNKVKFDSPKKAKYRVITIGGGTKSGGRGGLLFNDYILNKNEKIEIIIGESGDRLPVKHKQLTGVEKNYNDLLPYVGSCSGSGGTFIYKDNELIQASGGGGGWSSEIIRAPQLCNSVAYCYKNNGINTNIPEIVVPIKKIIIESINSSKSKHMLVVNKFDISVKNYEVIDVDVIENPPKDILNLKKSKYLYQTSYSDIGKSASIEFVFNEIITDYEINLDFNTISTSDTPYINSKIIIIDEQYRRLELKNYHNFYKVINSRNIIDYFVKTKKIYQLTHKYVENGNKTASKITDVVDNQNYFTKLNPNDKSNKNFILLKGGVGGGGHSISDRNTNEIYCGGGGGYIGGKSCIPNHNLDFNFDHVGACGGSSYIQQLNMKSEYIKYLDNYFVNDFNEAQGMVIIYEILDLQKTSNSKPKNKKDIEENILTGKADNETYFNKVATKNRNKYQDNFTKKTTRPNKNNDFKDISLDTKNFNIIKKTLELTTKSRINFIKIPLKKNSMKNLKILLHCSSKCQLQTILLNVSDAQRKIVKNDKARENNLLGMNHGFKNPSRKDIISFHELLCVKEIYKFMNYLEVKDIKNNTYQDNEAIDIFSFKEKIYHLKEKRIINLDLSQYSDYLYLLFKKPDNDKTKLKIDCVSVQYNSDSDTTKDLDNQIELI